MDGRSPGNAKFPSAICHLPCELLSQIIVFCQLEWTKEHFDEPIKSLQNLASVCNLWRHLVLSTPALWTTIHNALSSTQLKWCLECSGDLALSIRHYYLADGTANQSSSDAVFSQSHRWGEVVADSWVPHRLVMALELPTPYLTRLTLQNGSWVLRIQLHEAGPPFTKLILTGCALSWGLGRILGGQLADLHLANLRPLYAPSPHEVLNILASSPLLQTIHLSYISDAENPYPISGGHTIALKFPHLRHLTLNFLGTALFQHIMNHLSFPLPLCERLQIHHDVDTDHTSSMIIDQVRTMIRSQDRILIYLDYATVRVEARGVRAKPQSRWTLDLRLQVSHPDQMVTLIRQTATIALPDNDIHLGVLGSNAPIATIVPLLSLFEHARRISVDHRWGESFLQYYFVEKQADLQVPFPKLQVLGLKNLKEPLDVIRSWLGARWTRIDPIGLGSQGDNRSARGVKVFLRGGQKEMWATTPNAQRFSEVDLASGSHSGEH